jgi:hypothetical protein
MPMSSLKSVASGFLNKNNTQVVVHPTPANALRSIFDIQKLEESEDIQLQKLLAEEVRPGMRSEEQLAQDLDMLRRLTAEVKSISKQGILLIGERVHQARELLKNYGDGKKSLNRWIQLAFSNSRRTAFNALSYFEFHYSLPDEGLRTMLKRMPNKAAYVLASREGSLEAKAEIIREYHQQKAEEIIPVIQDKLPATQDKKKLSRDASSQLILRMMAMSKRLASRRNYLTALNKAEVEEVIQVLKSIV